MVGTGSNEASTEPEPEPELEHVVQEPEAEESFSETALEDNNEGPDVKEGTLDDASESTVKSESPFCVTSRLRLTDYRDHLSKINQYRT